MVKITEDLIRKRAEHNNCEISTLEEVSLHQQDIERIEYIDKWCRHLKILYLQSNLIPKIENVGRLKKLEYLNLALNNIERVENLEGELNNIERVENLEGCESLTKLDLTVNFIGELTSIECLKDLYNLKEMYLTGNPCSEYDGYREYVIATLQQLRYLDGQEVEKSERIKALQNYGIVRPRIKQQQEAYRKTREKQKAEAEIKGKQKVEEEKKEMKPGFDGRWYTDINTESGQKSQEGKSNSSKEADIEAKKIEEEKDEEDNEKTNEFWKEKVPYTPESRIEVHNYIQEQKNKEKQKESEKNPPKKPRRLFNDEGNPMNVNEPKIDFTLNEDEENNKFVLDLAIYNSTSQRPKELMRLPVVQHPSIPEHKHLDTSLMDVDVQTNYVRVTLKGKVFQLHLTEEVNPDSSSAQRSQVTGHLLVTMPKAKPLVKPSVTKKAGGDNKENEAKPKQQRPKEEKLEVDASATKSVDIGNIVQDRRDKIIPPLGSRGPIRQVAERPNSESFVDDPNVPPLE